LDLKTAPSALALSRQNTPALRLEAASENLSAKGAYELRAAEGGPAKATLFATGTEVALAVAARDRLQAEGVPTRVVSVPCWALFEQQPAAYRQAVIGEAPARVAVEAGVRQGWDRFIGEDGGFVGMTGFGASAPANRLYQEFAITVEAVVAAAKARL
jgi:transketolase